MATGTRLAVAATVLAALAVRNGASAQAAERLGELRCELRYASQVIPLRALPTDDPYGVRSHDIAGRFRFKAVVGGTAASAEYVKLYVYDMAVSGAPVLIHQATHHPPFSAGPVPALTGWNHVYSSVLGRELIYGCALAAVSP